MNSSFLPSLSLFLLFSLSLTHTFSLSFSPSFSPSPYRPSPHTNGMVGWWSNKTAYLASFFCAALILRLEYFLLNVPSQSYRITVGKGSSVFVGNQMSAVKASLSTSFTPHSFSLSVFLFADSVLLHLSLPLAVQYVYKIVNVLIFKPIFLLLYLRKWSGRVWCSNWRWNCQYWWRWRQRLWPWFCRQAPCDPKRTTAAQTTKLTSRWVSDRLALQC